MRTKGLTRAELLKRIPKARARLEEKMSAGEGKFARGLAREGFDGGYQKAIDDIEALLTHGCPNDDRKIWGNT